MTVLDAATVAIVLSVACPLLVCGLAFWVVCAVSGRRFQDDPTPFEDVPLWHADSGGGQDWDEVPTAPSPTLREESIPMPLALPVRYTGRILTPYGLALVHSGCLMARRDAATDHICPECGAKFGTKVGV